MDKVVRVDNEIYAILVKSDSVKDGSEWFGDQHESLQAQRMKYPAGSKFRVHQHILNPRTIKRTQEAFVVISGWIEVDVYATNGELIGVLEAGPGDAVFVYRGGHGVHIAQDAIVYEIKAGSFTYTSEDKQFIDGRGQE